jgi:F-type H+-transporting ATPase subunit a
LSTKQKAWISVAVVAVIGIALRFWMPVGKPLVSVRAEELFHIGGYTVTNSLLLTWVVMLLLIVLAVVATAKLRRGDEQALRQPRGLQNTMEYAVEAFYNTMSGVSPKYAARFFVIVATIFFLVLPANWAGLIPGVGSFGTCFAESELHHSAAAPAAEGASAEAVETEQKDWGQFTNQCAQAADAKIRDEAKAKGIVLDTPLTAEQTPEYLSLATELDESGKIAPLFHPILRAGSADLNLTLALALISFLTTEFWGFRKQGLGYLGKFFIFNQGPIQFFVGIIELISEFARIISFTFRLFGNIFAGEVVLLVMAFLFPTLLSLPFYGLELFVGAVQAFVFAMLTMAFIDMAGEAHGDHGHEEHAH